jgi:DNA-binding winged helix-turn-helix (wHTH) protein
MKEFPPFRLDLVNQCLWRRTGTAEDERILLAPKAFAVLRHLVEHAGQLVTQRELLDAIWPDTFIEPQAIKSHIFDIRRALGDPPKRPRFIETRPRRGYRFIAKVEDSSLPTTAAQTPRPASRLVGRDRAIGELHQCLRSALGGERQVVFITGEPGIGKTALAEEFQRQAAARHRSVRVACGQCVEGFGSKEAFYPMLEALGQLCRGGGGSKVVEILAAQAPTWLVQFPALLKPEHRETLQRELLGATRERMLREIGEALETIASGGPLLLLFEDLHWVDYSTVDLISRLARGRAPANLMLIATYRPADLALSDHPLKSLKPDLLARQLCHEIALEPLGEAEIGQYLTGDAAGAELPEGLAALVHRQSEGNPLFMVVALDHLRERRLIERQDGAWQLRHPLAQIAMEIPESLRQMIEAQIEGLSPEEQRVLEVASIAGVSFTPFVSAPAANLDPQNFEERCEALARRRHMVRLAAAQELPSGTIAQRYDFLHALYREVLYRRQAPAPRAMLHRRLAERLEAVFAPQLNELAPELAHHFEQGSDWPRAVRYLRLAADMAAQGYAYAPREATANLQHALDLAGKLPDAERAAAETEILDTLAGMYVVSFDMRAVDTYEALRARAVDYGLIDVEVRALIGMAYPLSYSSARQCLDLLERALRLSSAQRDSLTRARTRASCLVRRIWAGGWNADDVEECRKALVEIRRDGDRMVTAWHSMECNFLDWASSEYRDARLTATESLAVLMEGRGDNQYLSYAYWRSQFTLPWSLLFLGEWGEALREIDAGIAMVEKNGDRYRGQTLYLYRAWVQLHAMDFAGVYEICESVLPKLGEPAWSPWRRFAHVIAGSAEVGRGNHERALEHLLMAKGEMDRHQVIHDWYCRMLLQSALTDLWLTRGDLPRARKEGEAFLAVACTTAERTWQAMAWEANARIALESPDLEHARRCISNALSAMDGFEVPLAAWRVHATAAELSERLGDMGAAEHHRELGRDTILTLATSLPPEHPLRRTFLSTPSVSKLLAGSGIPAQVPHTP